MTLQEARLKLTRLKQNKLKTRDAGEIKKTIKPIEI